MTRPDSTHSLTTAPAIPSTGWRRALYAAAVLFLGAVAGSIALSSLTWPLSWDEGIFAWIGGILAAGGTPYVDAWDVKGPVAYAGYALADFLFGKSAVGLRVIDLMLSLAGTAAVYSLLGRIVGKRAASLAALLLFITVLGQGYNVNGQPDLWASWLLVFAVATLRDEPSAKRIAASAACIGTAMLIKPVYAALIVLLWFPVLANGYRNWRKNGTMAIAMLLGVMAPLVLCAAWFWSRGALQDFYSAYISFNVESGAANHRTLSGVSTELVGFLRNRRAVLVAIPAIGIGLLPQFEASEFRARAWRIWMIVAWTTILVALIILQNRWFTYHWAPTYPPLTVAACIGFHRISTLKRGAWARKQVQVLAVALLTIIALGASLAPIKQSVRSFNLVTHRISRDDFELAFADYPGDFTARDVRVSAEYVSANTKPNDYVLVWEDPNVNVMSGRRTPSRFAFWTPLLPSGELTPRFVSNREEFFASLEKNAPVLLLMERAAWRDGNPNTIAYLPTRFPALVQWIDAHYAPSDTVGAFIVFKRH